jgi:hypothetical protein
MRNLLIRGCAAQSLARLGNRCLRPLPGALMQFLIIATSPKRLRWLTAWSLINMAEWLSRAARRIVPVPPS